MSGWVGIPHAAVSAVRGPLARGAVLDLYSRAHQVGYTPMAFTDRELAEDWGMTRHEVWRVIEALEAAGLLTLERAPSGARKASRLTVHPAVSTSPGQTTGQTLGQNDRRERRRTAEPRPDSRPDSRPPRAEEIARASGDQTRPEPPVVPQGDPPPGEPDPFAAVWASVWEQVKHSPYPWGSASKDAAHIRTVAASCGQQDGSPPSREALQRFGSAATAYLGAAMRGDAWPKGEPPQLRYFASDPAKWVQLGVESAPVRKPQYRPAELSEPPEIAPPPSRRAAP